MAHPTRGHRSGTFEITEVVAVATDELSITVRHAGAYQPQTVRLNMPHTPAAAQLLIAMSESIKVGNHGATDAGWESFVTLRNSVFYVRIMAERLVDAGVTSFDDDRVDVPLLRSLYDPLHPNMKRSACHLLARAVAAHHANGPALANALKNSRFLVPESNPFVYDEAVSDAIETAARGVFAARYTEARDLFTALGFDTSGRGWLRIPAVDLIDWACQQHPEVCLPAAPEPSAAASLSVCAAWALTHPDRFGNAGGGRKNRRRARQTAMAGRVFYPDHVLLTAAMILHCVGENSGYNHSVLLEKNAASLTRIGDEHALEHNVKARNSTQDTRPTLTSSIYSPGGIVEVLTGMTRMSRLHREQLEPPHGPRPAIIDRLYVEHTPDPARAKVLPSERQHHGWRNREFDDHWDRTVAGRRDEVPMRMAALRLVAQRRAMAEGLTADVHGHTTRTRTHYAAHVLPDHVLNAHAVAAQNAFHDDALAAFIPVTAAPDGPAALLAATDPEDVMDVEIGVCTSGGDAPDGSGRRCDLGIVACFTCPNGFRTVDHVPGLLAAVELADIIERNDPVEWETGQASQLKFYAQACLREFPPAVVSAVKRRCDLTGHVLTVTGMYMEMRHG